MTNHFRHTTHTLLLASLLFSVTARGQEMSPPPTTPASTAKDAQTAAARNANIKSSLKQIARRMVEVQKATPDDSMWAIIQHYHLDNTAALDQLSPSDALDTLQKTAVALIRSAQMNDPVALQLIKEFKISVNAPRSGAAPPLDEAHVRAELKQIATRMVHVQQTMPDANIKSIIDTYQLGDAKALAALTPQQAVAALRGTALALYQASQKDDAAALQLVKEFQIKFTPPAQNAATPPPAK